jgi:ABC-type proline/glycine betaine transport system permease subunit
LAPSVQIGGGAFGVFLEDGVRQLQKSSLVVAQAVARDVLQVLLDLSADRGQRFNLLAMRLLLLSQPGLQPGRRRR